MSFDNRLLYESKEKQMMALLAEENDGKLLHQHYYQQRLRDKTGQVEEVEKDEEELGFELDSVPPKIDSTALLGDIEVGTSLPPRMG